MEFIFKKIYLVFYSNTFFFRGTNRKNKTKKVIGKYYKCYPNSGTPKDLNASKKNL